VPAGPGGTLSRRMSRTPVAPMQLPSLRNGRPWATVSSIDGVFSEAQYGTSFSLSFILRTPTKAPGTRDRPKPHEGFNSH